MEYLLKKGVVIEGRLTTTGSLNKVRVLPEMGEIAETDLLPLYPNFFAQNHTQYSAGDMVWVVCNEDFNIGFIVGLMQPPAGDDVATLIGRVNVAEVEAGFPQSGYNELSILKLGGKSITFENNVNGQSGTVYSTGVTILVSKDGAIWISNPKSYLTMTVDGDYKLVGKKKYEKTVSEMKDTGQSIERVAEKRIESGGTFVVSASGDMNMTTASNSSMYSTGEASELVGKKKSETYGTGQETKIASGGHTETVLLGDYTLTVGAGGISFTSGTGIKLTSLGPIELTSTMIDLKAPTIKVPMGVVAPGSGPFCALPFCLYSGAPHSGNISVGVPI